MHTLYSYQWRSQAGGMMGHVHCQLEVVPHQCRCECESSELMEPLLGAENAHRS